MIPLAVPNLAGKEKEYVADAIVSGWVGPDGPYVERFEDMVASAARRKWAVATTTGTAALEVSASVLGFAGKRIEVGEWSFPAMRNVLMRLGCEIKICEECGAHHDHEFYHVSNWPMIDDNAPAIGEKWVERFWDDKGTVECYSFAANKIVTCGQGGAICGDDKTLGDEIRGCVHQPHMVSNGDYYNFRIANINAALGCAQMERLDELKAAKKKIWNRYKEAGLPMMERGASRWMSTLEWQARDSGVYPALREIMDVRVEAGGVSIPCSTNLTEADQDKVIKCVQSLL